MAGWHALEQLRTRLPHASRFPSVGSTMARMRWHPRDIIFQFVLCTTTVRVLILGSVWYFCS